MPRLDYKRCKLCARHTDTCGPLSHTRLCGDCSYVRLESAIVEQVEHRGPTFQHWRTRIAASVGAILLDERAASGHSDGHA